MTSRNTDRPDILDAHLGLFRSPPHEQMSEAEERALHRLRSELAQATVHVRPSRPSLNWRFAIAGVAAAILIGAIALWRPADDALFRLVEGDAHVGGTIRSNGGGGAVLALADGSRIEMRSHTELSLERAEDGVRIRLASGGIIVNAAKQRTGHLYVQTKDMTVSVVGTVFVVNADNDGSRVSVIEGEVRVQQGATETKLRPGEFLDGRALLQSREHTSDQPRAVKSPSTAGFSVASELAWSRRAESLMALLQRQSAVEQRPANVAAPQAPKEPRVAFEVISIRPSAPAGAAAPGARGGGGGGLNSRPSKEGCVFDSFGYSLQRDPRRFAVNRVTLLHLAAYTIPASALQGLADRRLDLNCGMLTQLGLLSGGPDWVRTDVWDVVAAIPEGVFTNAPALSDPVLQQMLKTMLAEKFGLAMRRETRDIPVYLLKVGKDGPKFNGIDPMANNQDPDRGPVRRMIGPDGKRMRVPVDQAPPPDGEITGISNFQVSARNASMANLASHLFGLDGRPVIDRTGLTGRYDFHYLDQDRRRGSITFTNGVPDSLPDVGGLNRALVKEIGLELEEARMPFDVWVIERAEKPSEN
jgi:uncharacterized protein (TIGR03435 family)